MTTSTDIGTLITRNPGIGNGRPIIAGTGVRVRSVAIRYRQGRTPQEIADSYGHLSLAQVFAALTYYHANREEIEADIAEEDELYERLASEQERSRSFQK